MKAQREVRACVGCRLKPTTSMLALVSRRSLSRCIGTQTFCIRTHTALHALPTGEVNSSEPVPSITVLLLTRSDPRSVGAHYWAPPLSPSLAKLSSSGTRGARRQSHVFRRGLGTPLQVQRNLGKVWATSAAGQASSSGALGFSRAAACPSFSLGGGLPVAEHCGRHPQVESQHDHKTDENCKIVGGH